VSNNKLHAGRMIVNKYAKGKAKYEHYESNKSGNIDENDEYIDIDENTEEWDEFFRKDLVISWEICFKYKAYASSTSIRYLNISNSTYFKPNDS
jgi:hypothetical protein